nr:5327_t:CDS:2 [Entrophospora candida]
MNNLSIFDTHCHLADKEYQKQHRNTKEIIQEAEKVGVSHILNVGYDRESNQKVIKQLKEFSNLYGALGLHPNSNEDLRQLELAKKYDLPVLLHIRSEEDKNKFLDAFTDAYEIVKETGIKKGILHCFTGNWEIAQKFIALEKWEEVIEKVPLERIVVETDAPYLSPEPQRGKINYPSNIVYTLKKIGEQNDNPASIPLNKLSDQELEKCLLEDFSRRLELKKYFVFSLGELKEGNVKFNGIEANNIRANNDILTKHLTSLARKRDKTNILQKEFIRLLDDTGDNVMPEYVGEKLDEKIRKGWDCYILFEKNSNDVEYKGAMPVFNYRETKVVALKLKTHLIFKSKTEALKILKTDPALIS